MKTLAEGAQAPDFELPDENGRPVRLSEKLQDGPVVLFFYPIAMTGGCTKEACHFRDLAVEFKEVAAQRLGISTDPVAKQREFSELHGFDYPLLSDESGEVAVAYGVPPSADHPGEAGDLRDRHRPHGAEGHLQRAQHGRPRRPGARRPALPLSQVSAGPPVRSRR